MRNFRYKKYLVLFALLFAFMSLPKNWIEKWRAQVVGIISSQKAPKEELLSLEGIQGENHRLKNELTALCHALVHQKQLIERFPQEGEEKLPSGLELRKLYPSMEARVIFRDPHSWGSSVWVDRGKKDVEHTAYTWLTEGCPVIFGPALIGVVDYVGMHQSRIRLITDTGVKPSVRVSRGTKATERLTEDLERFIEVFSDSPVLLSAFEEAKKKIQNNPNEVFLAKGILEGRSAPLWQAKKNYLKGVGFNCEFEDSLSPARYLHSGELKEKPGNGALSIVKPGDLLVTTGMDGVFPAGLEVAVVQKVFPLIEGAVAYEFIALPVAKNLDSIQTVFIIPSSNFNPLES